MRQSSIVEQPAKEAELPLLVENFDLHEVGELAGERLHALLKPRQVGFDLRPQQRLHAVVGELRLQFANRAGGIAEEAGERGADAGLRPRAFEHECSRRFRPDRDGRALLQRTAAAGRWRLPQPGRRSGRTESPAGSCLKRYW